MATTLTILDYDDTLLATTFCYKNKIQINSPIGRRKRALLDGNDDAVKKFLEVCMRLGKVIILTNAEKSWVLNSCKRFMPKSYEIISSLDIYSARDKYGKSTNSRNWKKFFVLKDLHPLISKYRNVINVGDSDYERKAVLDYAEKYPGKVLIKTFLLNVDTNDIGDTIRLLIFMSIFMSHISRMNHSKDMILGKEGTKKKKFRKSQLGLVTPKRGFGSATPRKGI